MELTVNKSKHVVSNPYQYYDKAEAEEIIQNLFSANKDTCTSILNVKRPNIVVVLLESWSGDVIESIGGEKGVTNEFHIPTKEGLMFTNFYSTGFRTEQGQAAFLSGFPSQPTTTIVRETGTFENIPNILNPLKKAGYSSMFYYGGYLSYANTRSYLRVAGFDPIYGEEHISFKQKIEWGGYDEELFDNYLSEMEAPKVPFFHLIMTSTSHEPFNAPVDGGFSGDDKADFYRNTVSYTDKCLGDFMREAKSKSWYDSTLFIILTDHCSPLPYGRKSYEPERHHIPFLMFGNVLKAEYRGAEFSDVASHSDFVSTILAQLGLGYEKFKWSKNLFNPTSEKFAFFAFDEGFGWVNNEQKLVFDHQFGDIIYKSQENVSDEKNQEYLKSGKAYLQALIAEYVDF